MALENYYRTLGLSDFCTDQEKIRDAYRSQIKYFHPDLGNVSQDIAETKTKELNIAYEILSNPQKKQIYDSQLRNEQGIGQREYYYNSSSTYRNNSTYSNQNYTSSRNAYTDRNNGYRTNYNSNYTYKRSNYRSKGKGGGAIIFGLIVVLLLFSNLVNGGTSSSSSSKPSNSSSNTTNTKTTNNNATPNPDANLTPVSVSNGKMFKNPSDEANCKFTVETSGSNGYYVYLKDIKNSGRNDVAFYVKGGSTVSVDVPIGTYKLYYASGTTWYGTEHKFGYYTSYSTSDDTFAFTSKIKGDYIYYDHWTVTLYAVPNGNMDTERIDESQFPG